MALDVAVGSFNIGTGAVGTTVTITPGFETKALILWWSGRTESADAISRTTHLRGMGFAVSASSFAAWGTRDLDSIGTSNTDCGHRTDACIMEMGDGAIAGWADVQSISSTQVVFEILDVFATNLRVSYIALGGSDITGAEIGEITAPGSTGDQTINTTNAGKLIFFGATRLQAAAPTFSTQSAMTFGAATASAQYICAARAANGSGSGDTSAYCRSGDVIAYWSTTGDALTARASFVSFNTGPNSFTINWSAITTAHIFYLQLAGTFQAALGDTETTTATGTITESGLAFQPAVAMFLSSGRAASAAGTPTAQDVMSVGAAANTTDRLVQATASRDGNTNMFVTSCVQYDEVYVNIDPATQAITASADFTGFTSDGFTLDMDDAETSVGAFLWYVALASAAGGSYSITGSGGMSFAGAVAPIRGAVRTGAGGVSLAGTVAPVRGSKQPTPSGGVVLAGAATQVGHQNYVFTGVGGFAFAGAVTPVRGMVKVGAGSLAFSGTAPPLRGFVWPLPSGGAVFSGTATQFGESAGGASYSITGAGGMAFAGAVVPLRGVFLTPAGGLIFGGTTIALRSRVTVGSGGLAFSGTTTPLRGLKYLSAGGLVFEGTSIPIRGGGETPSGGVVFSGTASQFGTEAGLQNYSITGSGVLNFAGVAPLVRGSKLAGVGGMTFSGSVAPLQGRNVVASGQMSFGGSVVPLRGLSWQGIGGTTFGGASLVLRGGGVTPSGGIVFSGAAVIERSGGVISLIRGTASYTPIIYGTASYAPVFYGTASSDFEGE